MLKPVFISALFALCTLNAAVADCSSDMRLQNSIAEQYNSLAASPACESGAQQAVILGLLQQAAEVTARLENCAAIEIGTSVAELESMLVNFDSETVNSCEAIRAFQQPPDHDLAQCAAALAQMRKFAEDGDDVSVLKVHLAMIGCNTE